MRYTPYDGSLLPAVLGGAPYGTLYADPPWQTASPGPKGWIGGMATRPYPTMKEGDLVAMAGDIQSVMAPDSVIVMWSSWSTLDVALRLMGAWGFRYSTGWPWLKVTAGGVPIFGPGVWAMHCTEPLLIGRKGKPFGSRGNPRPARKGLTVSRRGRHSEKPAEIAEWIEAKLPGPWLELFARARRPGWACWGNEI